jgi:stalled ribosome rescue protein Dom34
MAKTLLDRLTLASESEKPLIIISIDDEGFAVAETKQYGVEMKVEERIRLPGKNEADKRIEGTKAYFRKALNSLNQLLDTKPQPNRNHRHRLCQKRLRTLPLRRS